MKDNDVKPEDTARAVGRRTGRRRRAWLRRTVPLAAIVATGALGLGACGGGSSSPGVTSGASATSATTPGGGSHSGSARDRALAYARCMRSHGVPDFPDPSSGQLPQMPLGADQNSPQFQAAQNACRPLAPTSVSRLSPAQQARALADLLKFSRCMRAHGEPNFPDPTRNGGLDIGGPAAHSPQFQRALQACRSYLLAAKPPAPAGS
jgi:hypothetical protein